MAVDPSVLATVAVGGAIGSLGRYAVGLALPHRAGGWPTATFVVNVSGALAMGFLVAYLLARPGTHRLARPFVGVGVLGGWTTFSSLSADVAGLVHAGHAGLAAAYVAGSFVVGVAAVAVGAVLGERIWLRG